MDFKNGSTKQNDVEKICLNIPIWKIVKLHSNFIEIQNMFKNCADTT